MSQSRVGQRRIERDRVATAHQRTLDVRSGGAPRSQRSETRIVCSSRSSEPRRSPRRSRPSRTRAGITLTAPGSSASVPTVATVSAGSARAGARSRARSRRRRRGRRGGPPSTPPRRGPACPVSSISSRRGAATRRTTPSSRSAWRWAMWISAWARTRCGAGRCAAAPASRCAVLRPRLRRGGAVAVAQLGRASPRSERADEQPRADRAGAEPGRLLGCAHEQCRSGAAGRSRPQARAPARARAPCRARRRSGPRRARCRRASRR